MKLGEWLRAKGMGQEEFASRAGVSQSQVSRLVAGKRRNPGTRVALAIERATDGAVPVATWEEKPAAKKRRRRARRPSARMPRVSRDATTHS